MQRYGEMLWGNINQCKQRKDRPMKYSIIIVLTMCLIAGCCTTPAPEKCKNEMDSKIQQLEERVEQLEKRVDELHPGIGVLPLE